MKLGLIGLDTSHVVHFAAHFNDATHPAHQPGFRIVAAFPGGSLEMPRSLSQVALYSEKLRDDYGVKLVATIEELASQCDAFLITSIDGAQHLEQLRAVVAGGKPVFIDKPFAFSSAEACAMFALARKHGTPLFSTSALRFERTFSQTLLQALASGPIVGCDIFGPMVMTAGGKGYFWYGTHVGDMLFRVMGAGYDKVHVETTRDADLLTVHFKDGRIGSLRGSRVPHYSFGGTLHTKAGAFPFVAPEDTAFYEDLTFQIAAFLRTGRSPVPEEETLELIAMLEAAEILRQASSGAC